MTNRKSTKKALLTSVIALVLCFSMLIGTTFAWFTDSVTSGVNQIMAGNLDIELDYWDGDSWEDVQDEDSLFTGNLWEPGHTEVVYLKVSNVGTLALKYELGINIESETAGINVAEEEFLLSDYIYMGIVEGVNGETAPYETREDAENAVDGCGIISTGYTDGGWMEAGEELYLAMVVTMPSWVGNEANYLTGTTAPTINMGIKLTAWQKDYESDSFDKNYDKDQGTTYVSNLDELKEALENGDNVVLSADITISADEMNTDAASIPVGVSVTEDTVIDLNGHDIVLEYEGSAAVIYAYNAELTIVGEGTIAKDGDDGFVIWARNSSDVIGEGVINIYDATISANGAETTLLYADSNEFGNYPNQGELCDFYGTINVYSGNLVKDTASTNPQNYFNVKNYGAGRITLYGGTFNWDFDWMVNTPAPNGGLDDKNFITIAEGYTSANNGDGTYTVLPGSYTKAVAEGLYSDGDKAYAVTSAAGLVNLNEALVNGEIAANGMVLDILADLDMTGSVWTPVDSHADTKFYINEIDGNGHTISNLTVNGQAMFTRFAGFGDVVVKNLTFDNATVNSSALNTAILTVQSYQNVLLDNVDVKNSTISGSYKVAALIATVYDEGSNAKVLTVKNCDVENCTVISKLDFMACGMVAYVATSSNESVVFENCTISDTTIKALSAHYNSVAYIYSVNGNAAGSVDSAEGVTVTNCKKVLEATVASGESISDAINAGATNINLVGTVDLGGGKNAYLNLSGKTVTITGGTIKGVGNDGELNSAVKANSGDIVFDGVTFELTDEDIKTGSWGMMVNVSGTANVTFKNCTFKGTQCPIYQSGSEAVVTLENCTFESTVGMIQCEIYSGDFQLGQDLIIKDCDFTDMDNVLHIYDYDKDPSSEAIDQYLTDNGNIFNGVCKQTCN